MNKLSIRRRPLKTRIVRVLAIVAGSVALCLLLLIATMQSDHYLSTAKWLFKSKEYKARVVAQRTGPTGELRHIEWEGWGWGGNDTVVYLVFDPDDALSIPAQRGLHGKFNGIPCEVPSVHRLESQWYTVQFYTDSEWGNCY